MHAHPNAVAGLDLCERTARVVGGAGLFGGPVCGASVEQGAHVVIADVYSDAALAIVEDLRYTSASRQNLCRWTSRKIQRRLVEDVAFRVFAAGNQPDFRTISDFR